MKKAGNFATIAASMKNPSMTPWMLRFPTALFLGAFSCLPVMAQVGQENGSGYCICPGTSYATYLQTPGESCVQACGLGGQGGSPGSPVTRKEMNNELRMGVTNAFMQGAVNGFISSLQRGMAQQQQLRLAFQQEQQRLQQEAAEQRRLAEQQRIDAMFARLDSELKLDDVPMQLQMKDMDTAGPEALHMKLDDEGPSSYGIKGLPGIYVGGPVNDASANTASTSVPLSGPGPGVAGPGIAGLPGVYLDKTQPSQAIPLAQAAAAMPPGPERDLAEDQALHAAQNNPVLTTPTQDPKVEQFQQAENNYQQSLQSANRANQQYSAAQDEVTADQSAIATAKSQLAGLQPTAEQQAALQKMLDVAKTDEAASEAARKIFEDANAHLTMARTQAIRSLADVPLTTGLPEHAIAHNAAPMLLRPPQGDAGKLGGPVVPMMSPSLHKGTAPASATSLGPALSVPPVVHLRVTHALLCEQLAGAQKALRRLMEVEAMQQETRGEWEKKIDSASDRAWERGADMLRDGIGDWMASYIKRNLLDTDKKVRALRQAIEQESDPGKLEKLRAEWGTLQQNRSYLKDALERSETNQKVLDKIALGRDNLATVKDYNGDLESKLDGVRQVVDDMLATDSVRKKLGIPDEVSEGIEYGESIVDSSYDILAEAYGARRIKQLNRNTDLFLEAQRKMRDRIQSTVAQLKLEEQDSPPGEGSCGPGPSQ